MKNIGKKLRLKKLKRSLISGAFAEQKRKKMLDELRVLIKGALFLQDQEERKAMWLDATDLLSNEEIDNLKGAILRENIRWKKNERKIKFDNLSQDKRRNLKIKKPLTIQEKEEVFKSLTSAEEILDLDLAQSVESKENQESLDKMSFTLLLTIAEVFEKQGFENFRKTKLRLKVHPESFANISSQSKKAFLQISRGLKDQNWQGDFSLQWSQFVDSVAESFLLAKNAESEILKTQNNFPTSNFASETINKFKEIFA